VFWLQFERSATGCPIEEGQTLLKPTINGRNLRSGLIGDVPVIGSGGRIKAAVHNNLSDRDPKAPVQPVSPEEVASIRSFWVNSIPTLANCAIDSDVCLYKQTPDGEFLLGALPGFDDVFTAALAGHGFNFTPVLGEILADLIAGTEPAFDVSRFSPERPL
jgi:sarcosine oxidase